MKKFQKQAGQKPKMVRSGILVCWNFDPPLQLPPMPANEATCVKEGYGWTTLYFTVSNHTSVEMEFPTSTVAVLWERQL